METFAEKVISFFRDLNFDGKLPEGVAVMNPFRTNPVIFETISQFYRKYYNDMRTRHLIMGINPGRFGAGVTGIPFTDTIRLREKCGLTIEGLKTHETSSVFVYRMIDRYGGPEKFYGDFYVTSVSPLGFVYKRPDGKEINCNYYDNRKIEDAILEFAVDSIRKQLDFGIKKEICFCLGTGKNFRFLSGLNRKYKFFERIEPLEHPRFIMQYKSKHRDQYVEAYVDKFHLIKS